MAIRIEFLANIVDLIRGNKRAAESIDDVADSLDDVVRDARRAGDMLGDRLDDGARDAGRSVDRLEGSFRDLARTAQRTTDTSERGFRDMSENVQGFRDEAVQNFSEVASSFSGDVDDMVGGVQGLTGGLASALTPGIGIPVAVLGAAAGAFLANWQTSTEQSAEHVENMFRHMLESGQSFLTEDFIQTAIADLAADTNQWNLAMERQRDTGVEVGTILRAMVGDAEAIGIVRQAEADKLAEQLELINQSADSEQIKADKIDAANLKYSVAVEWLDKIIADTNTAADKAAAVGTAFESPVARAQQLRDRIAETVRELEKVGQGIDVQIRADTTGVEGALAGLQGRTISVNVAGQITRIGNQVWD